MDDLTPSDFQVRRLGPCRFPADDLPGLHGLVVHFVDDHEHIPYHIITNGPELLNTELAFERAGVRRNLFFDPSKVTAGIVTCGGVCPGLNDVIRALFMSLHYTYGVTRVLGFRYGFRGLDPDHGKPPMELNKDNVEQIHTTGGTILGTARGSVPAEKMVQRLKDFNVNMLFVVGGDGSQKGAHAISKAADDADYPLAVIGVPKTIDNDIDFMDKTFGLDSAVACARDTIDAAHTEARDNYHGIGLVKVMGRDSGFIAALATLASLNVNYVLVPEVKFDLDELLARLERRITDPKVHHAVVVVAEGAGQDLMKGDRNIDASGNVLHKDIGLFLKQEINDWFRKKGIEVNLKYFDPSYLLRSQPCNANDSIYAAGLAQYAVHAAMAGRTDVMIGQRHNQFIHVPIPLAVRRRKKIDPRGELWLRVLQATGQPAVFGHA
ncbi:MAG: ATP-dependent 6-phosphofructokinase [Acidobacteriota bacterium]|nr:ATP-dependent 6-phosphofructokinase [Acidobacteriota bacterium]